MGGERRTGKVGVVHFAEHLEIGIECHGEAIVCCWRGDMARLRPKNQIVKLITKLESLKVPARTGSRLLASDS